MFGLFKKKKKSTKKTKFVPRGRTFTTNDNYLGKSKTGSKKKRPIVAIESNNKGEIIAVPLSTKSGSNRTRLPNYQNGKTYYKHFVEIEDNEGKPIKANEKFKANHKNMDISKTDVDKIRDTVFNHSKQSKTNNEKRNKFLNKKND